MNIVAEKNIMLPMHDGVKLATDVYRPAEKGPWPVLLTRLMYDKSNEWFLNLNLDIARTLQAGYAVVVQDVRGRYASEGESLQLSSRKQVMEQTRLPGSRSKAGAAEKSGCLALPISA